MAIQMADEVQEKKVETPDEPQQAEQKKSEVIEKKPVKLLVGLATLDISYECFTSFNKFWTDVIRSARFEVGCKCINRTPTVVAQEELAKFAVDSGATHLLIIDDDVYDYTLLDLIKLLEADVDMIGGCMMTRKFPYHMCAMRRLDPSKPIIEHAQQPTGFDMYEVPVADRQGIKPVDLISFGFTLFKTSLFKKLKRPYFIPDPSMIDESKLNYQYQKYTDSIFCDKVFKVGSQPYAHFDVWLNHHGVTRNNVNHWIGIYQQSGMLTQPGIKMNPNELLEYKMIVKEKLVEAEERYKSSAIDRIKYFKEVETEEKPEENK